jgi:inorganic pyrophosphatase
MIEFYRHSAAWPTLHCRNVFLVSPDIRHREFAGIVFIMARSKNASALADPSLLSTTDPKDDGTVRVVIETPKGSRNKYAFDEDERVFVLKKVLPSGMAFPYDFGFVPSTKAEDGDPIDVLVLMDEPAFPGCVLKCRPVGVIEGEEGKKGDKERNDRIVAIEQSNHRWAHVKHIRDLGKHFLAELQEFFVNYHELSGKKYKVIDVRGPKEACRRIDDCSRRANGKKA